MSFVNKQSGKSVMSYLKLFSHGKVTIEETCYCCSKCFEEYLLKHQSRIPIPIFSKKRIGKFVKIGSFSEPTGAVRPKVTKKSIDVTDVVNGTSFVGLCPGQGFPVPRYR